MHLILLHPFLIRVLHSFHPVIFMESFFIGTPCSSDRCSCTRRKTHAKFVKRRLVQKEKRVTERPHSYNAQPDFALSGNTDARRWIRQTSVCSHRNRRGHPEPKCWQQYSHLKPGHKYFVTKAFNLCDRARKDSNENSCV